MLSQSHSRQLSLDAYATELDEAGRTNFSRLAFWLPVLLIAVAVFDNHSRLEYAETAIGMHREYRNEVEYSTSSSRSKQLTFLSFGAIGAILLLRRNPHGREISTWTITGPAVMLLFYMFTSAVWSDSPSTTIKRSILAACIAIGGWGLGKAWSFRQICRCVLYLSATFLIAGIAAEIYVGTFLSLAESEYRFSGLLHPARQAFSCSMMALACFALYRVERRKLFLFLAAMAIAFTMLTKARTGAGALFIASLWFWGRQLSLKRVLVIGWLSMMALSLLLIYSGTFGSVVDINELTRMGRQQEIADPTQLTGRLPIWSSAMGFFWERPVTGYGYGAFWIPRRILLFERQTGWTFTHAHSAYVETMVNLGLLGLFLGLATIFTTVRQSAHLGYRHRVASSFVGSLLLFGLITGVTESAFIDDGYELIMAATAISYIAHRTQHGSSDGE